VPERALKGILEAGETLLANVKAAMATAGWQP